jgi:hypothetical protein
MAQDATREVPQVVVTASVVSLSNELEARHGSLVSHFCEHVSGSGGTTRNDDRVSTPAEALSAEALSAETVPAESLAIPLRQQGLLWARQILENKGRRRALASDEFAFDDLDHDGVLTKAEAFLSIQRVSRLVDLPLPKQERCDRLFDLCDKDSDGLLQPVEFRTYFKTLLGSAVRRGGKAIRTSAAIADAPAPSQARCSLKES